jgi:uncharacterized membrane protein YdjX (TVP38/TMEM64 family)
MWWQYLLVFCGALMMDITPFPLPPACTVMIILQTVFGLSIWPVIVIGLAGSILGRVILTYYIPVLSEHILKPEKNEDIRLLGEKIKTKGWKAQLFILVYTLLPLPSTPLFIAGGIARVRPFYILPAFIMGKFTTDTAAVFMGQYAAVNSENLLAGSISSQSVMAVLLFLILMFLLFFVDWRLLLHEHEFKLRFNIWK